MLRFRGPFRRSCWISWKEENDVSPPSFLQDYVVDDFRFELPASSTEREVDAPGSGV